MKIDIVYFKAGGGHYATALALQGAFESRGHQVRLIDLREALEPMDWIRRWTGIKVEDVYNWELRHGLTPLLKAQLRFTQLMIRMNHQKIVGCLRALWPTGYPDKVISVVPNFNRQIWEARTNLVDMFVVMTDMADSPPHFWVEPECPYPIFVPTPYARDQALNMGMPESNVIKISGLPVRSGFYTTAQNKVERLRYALSSEIPTGVVMYGGYGSSRMLKIAKAVATSTLQCQFIFICGDNKGLVDEINSINHWNTWIVTGRVTDVPYYFSMADFFIGKPGPGSITEAIVSGLPVIIEDRHSMFQELYNLVWVQKNKVGIIADDLAGDLDPIRQMTRSLAMYKEAVRGIRNNALAEIADAVEESNHVNL